MSLEELIQATHQLDETDLNRLLREVNIVRIQRKANVLPEIEAYLLEQINQTIPVKLRHDYQVLRAKREAEILTEDEYQSLIKYSMRIEDLSARRLEAMAQLAQLRQVSLSQLMEILEIPTVAYV